MEHLEGNTTDAAVEKHVPVVECVDGGYVVKVGSAEHPMTPEHYIQWIELQTETMVLRKELTPVDKPEAFFRTDEKVTGVREYCNLHGLWRV
jgi:superoxide reductase